MRSQRVGRRYLAGLVIVAAVLQFGVICAGTVALWPTGNHRHLLAVFLFLGLVPDVAALLCGFRAWSAQGGRSSTLSACGLLILLAALAAARLGF
jgi:hypothetical protein